MVQDSTPPEPGACNSMAIAPPPPGRPSWSGLLQFSLVSIPVKAYPAVSTTDTVHFNQLHADCGLRIRYEKRRPVHGPVETAAIVKGYPYAPDRRAEPVSDPGRSGRRAALPGTQRQRGKWAIGRVVLSGRRQVALLRPAGVVLAVDLLHYPAEVSAAPAQDVGSEATPEELNLANIADRHCQWTGRLVPVSRRDRGRTAGVGGGQGRRTALGRGCRRTNGGTVALGRAQAERRRGRPQRVQAKRHGTQQPTHRTTSRAA